MLSAYDTEVTVFRPTLASAGTDIIIAFDSEGEAHGPYTWDPFDGAQDSIHSTPLPALLAWTKSFYCKAK